METRAKTMIGVILLVIVAVTVYRFKAYMLDQQYDITAQSACDPAVHNCFALDCDPADQSCDPSPYEKVTMLARSAPACLLEHSCETDLSCAIDTSGDCQIRYCSADSLGDGETCTTKP